MTKFCNRCGLNKEVSEFAKHAKRYDGLQSQCRLCHKSSKDKYELSERGHIRRLSWKKQWRQTPKGKLSTARNNHIRRITVDVNFNLSPNDWVAILEIFDNKCAYCQKSKKLTIDHDWPVKLGGSTDKYNCLPACRSCNSKKWKKLLWSEFVPYDFNWDGFVKWKEFCFGKGAYQAKETIL